MTTLETSLHRAEVVLAARFPADLRREPFPHEYAVNFALIDSAINTVAGDLADKAKDNKQRLLQGLYTVVATAGGEPGATTQGLTNVLISILHGRVRPFRRFRSARRTAADLAEALQTIQEVTEQMSAEAEGVLDPLAAYSFVQALGELRGQGFGLAVVQQLLAKEEAAASADLLATEVRTRTLDAVRDALFSDPEALALSPQELGERVIQTALESSDRAIEEAAQRVAIRTSAAGRTEAHLALQDEVGAGYSVFASEILDRNVCGPCSTIDGTRYSSMADAMLDYPRGQYRHCKGGTRCRGQLVVVADERLSLAGYVLPDVAFHLPGKHDQRRHAKGGTREGRPPLSLPPGTPQPQRGSVVPRRDPMDEREWWAEEDQFDRTNVFWWTSLDNQRATKDAMRNMSAGRQWDDGISTPEGQADYFPDGYSSADWRADVHASAYDLLSRWDGAETRAWPEEFHTKGMLAGSPDVAASTFAKGATFETDFSSFARGDSDLALDYATMNRQGGQQAVLMKIAEGTPYKSMNLGSTNAATEVETLVGGSFRVRSSEFQPFDDPYTGDEIDLLVVTLEGA